jgi:hypothetical protein
MGQNRVTDTVVEISYWMGKVDSMYAMVGKNGSLTGLDRYIKLRQAIRSTDQDVVAIAKVAIKLIEGKRWD